MYRDKIRNKVNEILKGNFTQDDYKIHFGYDCVDIELFHQIFTDKVRELEKYFGADVTLIYVNEDGNLVLMYDVSDFVLDEYGSWKIYDEQYGYVW